MIPMKLIDIFFVSVVFVIVAISLVVELPATLYQENGTIENLQAALLLASSLLFLLAAKNKQQTSRNVAFLLALVTWVYFLREIEIKGLGLPTWAEFLFADDGRKLLAIPLLGLLIVTAKQTRHYYINFSHYIKSPMAAYLILAALAIIISYPFDKKLITIGQANLWEETIELVSCLCVVMSAYKANASFSHIERLCIV